MIGIFWTFYVKPGAIDDLLAYCMANTYSILTTAPGFVRSASFVDRANNTIKDLVEWESEEALMAMRSNPEWLPASKGLNQFLTAEPIGEKLELLCEHWLPVRSSNAQPR